MSSEAKRYLEEWCQLYETYAFDPNLSFTRYGMTAQIPKAFAEDIVTGIEKRIFIDKES